MKKDITLIYIIKSNRAYVYRALNILSKCEIVPREIIVIQTYRSNTRFRTSQFNLNIKVIEPESFEEGRNMRYAEAVNLAIAHTTSPYLALLNEFCVLSSHFIEQSYALLQRRPNLYTATPRSLSRPLEEYEGISDCDRIATDICPINHTDDIEEIDNPLSLLQFSFSGPKSIFENIGTFSEFYETVVITLADYVKIVAQKYCPIYKTNQIIYVQQYEYYYPPLHIQNELIKDVNSYFGIWSQWPIPEMLKKIVRYRTVVWKADRKSEITQFIKPTRTHISSTLQKQIKEIDTYCA